MENTHPAAYAVVIDPILADANADRRAPGLNAEDVERVMRATYGTLDHLPHSEFRRIALDLIDELETGELHVSDLR